MLLSPARQCLRCSASSLGELPVGVELAPLGRLAAVEKCSRLSGQRLSDLKTYNLQLWIKKRPLDVY